MKNLIVALIILLSLLSYDISAADANVRDLESSQRCKSALQSVNLEEVNDLLSSNIVKYCNDSALNNDLSIQVLGLVIGEPLVYLLDISSALGLGWHTAKKTDNLFHIMKPIHDMLGAFNWLLFYVMLGLFSIIFVIQLLRWARSEEKKGFMKWLNRNFTQNTLSMIMCMPVMGWMTPIQVIAAVFIIVIVYAAKMASTLFFAGLFMADTAGNILSESTPYIEDQMMETVMIYRCDILRREDLINGLISANNYNSRSTLDADPLFQCLQSSAGSKKIRNGLPTSNVAVLNVTLPVIDNFYYCISEHKDYIKKLNLSPVNYCGYSQLMIPKNNGKEASIKDRVDAMFLNENIQSALRTIAMTIQEYSCRFRKTEEGNQLGTFAASCANMSMSSSSYQMKWVVDPISGREMIARHLSPLNDTSKKTLRQTVELSKAQAINAVIENQPELIALLRDLLTTKDQHGELPTDERDIDNLINKMEKGAWMTASVFVSKTAKHVDNKKLAQAIGQLYKANSIGATGMLYRSLSTLDSNWLLIEDLEPLLGRSFFTQKVFSGDAVSYSQSLIMGVILPEFGLYKSQLTCWQDQSQCEASVLNPFIDLSKAGSDIFFHAFIGSLTTSALSKLSNQIFKFTGVRSKIMAVAVLDDFFMLYMVIAIMLAVIIPAYPLLKILSMFAQWGLEVTKELIGLQLSLAFSPLSEPGRRVITDDVRSAFSRLIALGLYFLFVVFGIMVMFITFSFLFSLNVLLMGGLSVIVQFTSGSHFIESVFLGIVFDVLVTLLIFLEVKACTDLIEKIPGALAERFSLELSSGENIGEQIVTKFRTYVMPGVQQFMTSLK